MRVVKPKSPGMVLLLNVITCGIYSFFWMYRQQKI